MPGIRLERLTPWEENGEILQRLAVTFPAGFATQNSCQIYFFDATGLLRRHHYFPDVLNGTSVVQLVDGYREFSGIKFPTDRKVYRLSDDGSYRPEPVLVSLQFRDIILD